jgi:dihydrofolate synthase/folylpolyglutamate synthase
MYAQLPMFHREGKVAYKANLNNIIALAEMLGNPQKKYKTIHIAGTNGKGSVSHIIASILQHAGYKTGLFTSPHLLDFRERIKVNGQMVDEEFVISFIEKCKESIKRNEPSFFEMTTAMAFSYFDQQNVDIAVVETGLGGRLDATNIIEPILSVITNISMDHTDILGNTLAEIAFEKAGIIKSNTPVIVGEKQTETDSVFISKSEELNAAIIFAQDLFESKIVGFEQNSTQIISVTDKKNKNTRTYNLDLLGNYQQKNLSTVLCSINQLIKIGISIDDESIMKGISSAKNTTGLMGRWQILGEKPLIVVDTGHNEEGIKFVVNQLKSIVSKQLHIVFGMVNDKDPAKVLCHLPIEAEYYLAKFDLPRAKNEVELMQQAAKFGLKGNSFPSVKLAIEAAKLKANQNDTIFIGGSTFVVAEALIV